jgi:formate hydrogenlyase subunit 3/multisubunit Na+/H+ antiporter MnhD subunit
MLAGLRRVHTCFSSEQEVAQLRSGSPQTVLSMLEEIAKRRIHSMWITATHSLLYTFLLVYLGAFYICEQNTMKGGVCNFLSVTIIHVPWLNFNFHFVIAAESFSVFLTILIFGVVGDCYLYSHVRHNHQRKPYQDTLSLSRNLTSLGIMMSNIFSGKQCLY